MANSEKFGTDGASTDFVSGFKGNLERSLDTKDILQIIGHHRWFIAAASVLMAVFVLIGHYVCPSFSGRTYVIFETEGENSGISALLGSLGVNGESPAAYSAESAMEKTLLTLRSPDFFRELSLVIASQPEYATFKNDLKAQAKIGAGLTSPIRWAISKITPTGKDLTPIELGELLKNNIRVTSKNKGVVEVVVTSSTKELAVFLGNHYLDTVVKVFSAQEDKKLKTASQYIQDKIAQTIKKMEESDQKIIGLNTKNASNSLLAPQTAIAEKLLQLKVELQKSKMLFDQNTKVIENLKAKLASTLPPLATEDPGGMSKLGLQKTVSNLEVENQLLSLRIETMQNGLDTLLKANMSLPKDEQSLSDLKRQKSLDYFVFDNLYKTHLQIEVKGLSLLNRVYPLSKLTVDDITVATKPLPKALLALLFALGLASLAVYAKQVFSPVIRTKKDIEGLGLFFLGNITQVPEDRPRDTSHDADILRFDTDFLETICFKHIRSRIVHLSNHSGTSIRKVIGILSYGNGEGKSFVSANLAACFANSGFKTILVDFDLRRASVSKRFSLTSDKGLATFFDKRATIDSLITKQYLPNLDVLNAGKLTDQTTELVTNRAMQELFEILKQKYDYIIVDSAPVLAAPESLVLAKEADLAILMATSWKTKREYVADALDEIKQVRNAATHLILNKVSRNNISLVSNYYYMASSKSFGRNRPQQNRKLETHLDN